MRDKETTDESRKAEADKHEDPIAFGVTLATHTEQVLELLQVKSRKTL
jgi:hypothetical protein